MDRRIAEQLLRKAAEARVDGLVRDVDPPVEEGVGERLAQVVHRLVRRVPQEEDGELEEDHREEVPAVLVGEVGRVAHEVAVGVLDVRGAPRLPRHLDRAAELQVELARAPERHERHVGLHQHPEERCVRVRQVAVERAHQVVGLRAHHTHGLGARALLQRAHHAALVQPLHHHLHPPEHSGVPVPRHHRLPLALLHQPRLEEVLPPLLAVHLAARLEHRHLVREHRPPAEVGAQPRHLFGAHPARRVHRHGGGELKDQVARGAAEGGVVLPAGVPHHEGARDVPAEHVRHQPAELVGRGAHLVLEENDPLPRGGGHAVDDGLVAVDGGADEAEDERDEQRPHQVERHVAVECAQLDVSEEREEGPHAARRVREELLDGRPLAVEEARRARGVQVGLVPSDEPARRGRQPVTPVRAALAELPRDCARERGLLRGLHFGCDGG
mmetsp:Transcript_46594/g.115558  ORF Transcript_46594/g.115558 Transcript_46594/m.115558 type:complete len:442 (-) Transcript_46594:102-1427(-)